mgnify:CR=1 FL=1
MAPYLEKDGQYIKAYPPLGDGVRDAYDEACSNTYTPWGISDHDRHTREIQNVACRLVFAQDHTHEVTKNCFKKKQLGATALWDVATETGEIASAVLVPTTKTEAFAHAAASLTRRNTFTPSAMYSDTWPVKKDFWELLFHKKTLTGRLGLFHYVQRITRTMKKKHPDHFVATNGLLQCIYQHNDGDYENLLRALKGGTLSKKHTDEDIADLKASKVFRQRCDKHLRKEIRPPHVISSMLDDWFDQYKCEVSNPNLRPARGRYDPLTGETLFSSETKEAIKNAKLNAPHLQDPLPLHQMYLVTQPNPNASHQLPEHISRRGESNLESFHGMLAHFGNCGMRTSLADNLNLTGTARFNMGIRHRIRLPTLTPQNPDRKKIPAAFESTVSFFNHSELNYVNKIALATGVSCVPFPNTEMLPPDNGERFFSEYISWLNDTKPPTDSLSRCLCGTCNTNMTKEQTQEHPRAQPQPQPQPQQPTKQTPTTENDRNTTNHKANDEQQNLTTVGKADTVHPNQLPAHQVHQQQHMHPQQQQQHAYHHHQQPIPPRAPQPHQHQHHHAMMMMGYAPQTLPQFPPWFMVTNPMPMPTQTAAFCCSRCRCWYNTVGRRGRPPHDGHCQQPRTGTEKKRRDNPSWRVI